MISITINRDSVCMGDDIDSHKINIEVSKLKTAELLFERFDIRN